MSLYFLTALFQALDYILFYGLRTQISKRNCGRPFLAHCTDEFR